MADSEQFEDEPEAVAIAIPVAGASDDEGEPMPDFHGWRKPVRNILLVAAALITGGSLHSVAEAKLQIGWAEFNECIALADYGGVIDDPEDCRPGRLLLSSIWPTTREGVHNLREHSDHLVDAMLFTYDSRVDFDRLRRAAALERLLENPGFLDSEPLLLFDHNGAREEILAFARAADSLGATERSIAHDSALLLAEIEALREIEAKPGSAPRLSFVSRLALNCLLEPETRTQASAPVLELTALGGADERRLTLIACRDLRADAPELERANFDDSHMSGWTEAWLLSREVSKKRAKASEWLLDNWYSPARAGPLAQAIAHEQPTAAQVLLWLAPERTWAIEHVRLEPSPALAQAGRGMIALRPDEEQLPLYDPNVVLSAARTLVVVAQGAELQAELAELPEGVLHPEARAQPTVLLTDAAVVLAGEAAREWLARGQREQALAVAHEAMGWGSTEFGWISAGLCALAGDGEGALEWVAARREAQPQPTAQEQRTLVEIELRALATLGRWGEAYGAAQARLTLARAGPSEGRDQGYLLHLLTWASALGEAPVAEPVWLSDYDEWSGVSWSVDYMEPFIQEERVYRGKATQRLSQNLLSPARAYPDLSLLVAARLVDDPSQVEYWADVLLDWTPEFGRELYFMRAELARYHGNAEAERRWRDAAARMLALGDSEERVLLLHLAGV